jgi:hypothetical protein
LADLLNLSDKVDDDEVENDVGKDEVRKAALSADAAELTLVGRVYLNRKKTFIFCENKPLKTYMVGTLTL